MGMEMNEAAWTSERQEPMPVRSEGGEVENVAASGRAAEGNRGEINSLSRESKRGSAPQQNNPPKTFTPAASGRPPE